MHFLILIYAGRVDKALDLLHIHTLSHIHTPGSFLVQSYGSTGRKRQQKSMSTFISSLFDSVSLKVNSSDNLRSARSVTFTPLTLHSRKHITEILPVSAISCVIFI